MHCILLFLRSKVSESFGSLDTRVPCVSGECKDRRTYARVANNTLLVPRMAQRRWTQSPSGARLFPWARQPKRVPKRFVKKRLTVITLIIRSSYQITSVSSRRLWSSCRKGTMRFSQSRLRWEFWNKHRHRHRVHVSIWTILLINLLKRKWQPLGLRRFGL